MTYKRVYADTWGDGERMLTHYECKENPRITIRVEYGWETEDRPQGYTLLFDGNTDFTRALVSYQTLKEAKQDAEFYFKG